MKGRINLTDSRRIKRLYESGRTAEDISQVMQIKPDLVNRHVARLAEIADDNEGSDDEE